MLRDRVDRDDPACAKKQCAADRKLSDRPAAPDRDGLAVPDVAEVRGHVAWRNDVGQEQDLLVREPVLDLDWSHISIGHAQVFRSTSWIASQDMRIAEETRGGVAPKLFRRFAISIGSFAGGIESLSCKKSTLRRRS